MKGYWNRPEDTAATFADGWFLTGDHGYMDEKVTSMWWTGKRI
ncbi:hypothetical protein LSPH24S_06510 [Lysinibacillus sphaericus]